MYQMVVMVAVSVERTDGPVCITRSEMRPAKSFWKNAQLCRTTCQCACHRINPVNGAAIAWLVISESVKSTIGRATSTTSAMPSSQGQQSVTSRSGGVLVTMVTTRPMNHGTALSLSATSNSTTNSATNSHLA